MLSYSIKTIVENFDLTESGIQITNQESDIDWGNEKEIKIIIPTLDVPFQGLKIILNSDSIYVHQLLLNPGNDILIIEN